MRVFLLIIISIFITVTSCQYSGKKNNHQNNSISGDLIVFHAGSLSVPFQQVADSFMLKYPNINIKREAAGSVTCARKISELHRPCDVMASADYNVINKLLIPEYAYWNIKFASNEMVIAYHHKSKYRTIINSDNWFDILEKHDVIYGRSDPDADPCGYRTILVLKLAEKYYHKPGLAGKIINKDNKYIRPKEVDLIALAESNVLDYFFIYRSVAIQHQLNYLNLPDSINLKSPGLHDFYSTVEVKITGNQPDEYITQQGEPMVYGITIPKNAPNYFAAIKFVRYLLGENKGMRIMSLNGQPSVIPSYSKTYNNIPDDLKEFATN